MYRSFIHCIFGYCLLFAASQARGLQVDQPVHDFGKVPDTVSLEHTWNLHNDTARAVKITQVSLGCEVCMEYVLEAEVLAPGQSASLTVWLDPLGFDGAIAKEIILRLGGNAAKSPRLQLRAHIVPAYSLSPSALRIAFRDGGEEITRRVKVRPLLPLNGVLEQVSCVASNVTATVKPMRKGVATVVVKVAPGWSPGISDVDLRILSSDKSDPPCVIKLIVSQDAEVEVTPPSLSLAANTRSQSRILFVKSDWESCGVLEGVAFSGNEKALRHRIDRGSKPGEYRVFLEIAEAESLGHGLDLQFSTGAVMRVPIEIRSVKPRVAHKKQPGKSQ